MDLIIPSLILVVLAVTLVVRFFFSASKCLPPGPRPHFLLGNIRDLPTKYQEKTFAKWRSSYGDVVHISILGRSVVILNSALAANDLLSKKSAIYSDRPHFVLITELMGWDSVVTHFPYGPRFRKHRRFIQEGFNATAIPNFREVQLYEARILLDGLLKSPDIFMLHIRRFTAATILRLTYGHTVKSLDDIHVRTAERAATETIEAGSPGSMIVDFFPALKYLPTWMPGTAFKRDALKVRITVQRMLTMPFEMVKDKMKLGIALPSFTSQLLEGHTLSGGGKIDPRDEQDIKGAAGVLYGAAVDTTVAVLGTFLLAMVLNPDVYRKAQDEIDRVIGTDRLPTLNDRPALPYLDCVLKEAYRWNAAVPLAIPHKVTEDDVYRGYHIPKDAMIIPNIWAMTQDPEVYPEPHVFRPGRFEKQDSPDGGGGVPDPRDIIFGFGRRACPGKLFGDTSVWIAAAGIVAAFAVETARDELGKEVVPPVEFTSGFVSHAKPFKCRIYPRSRRAVELVSEACVETEVNA